MLQQKNEWAEIYGQQTRQIEKLQSELNIMNVENDKLMRRLELAERGRDSGSGGESKLDQREIQELQKRLRKREHECQALWESLKEMRERGFNYDQMMSIFGKR